ncbi:MAG TPA: metallophosphoesterase [Thermoplasmata archaeon]
MEDLNMLVCSDLHGSGRAADLLARIVKDDDYDIVVICGDFTTFGSPEYVKSLLKKVKVKILAVPGNCDTPDTVTILEKAHASVHNRKVEFGGWRFFGFGGGVPTNSGMPFEVDEAVIEKSLRGVAAKHGVMVTHTPAYGMNDRGRSGKHAGSKAILRVAKEFSPRLVLSGHMHESAGKQLSGSTVFVNPGSLRNGHYASIWLGSETKVKLHGDESFSENPKTY